MSEGKSLHGDKSAWDTTDNAGEHAKDIDEGSLRRHLPLPGNVGNTIYDDGTKWYSGPSSGSTPPVAELDDIGDVNVPSPVDGDALLWDDGEGEWTSGSIGGGGTGGGHVIEDEGTPLAQRTKLNFEGAGVEVTDDAGDDASVVTITAGSEDLYWDLVTNGDSADPGLVFTAGDVVWTKI
jgi:hypothetical protein